MQKGFAPVLIIILIALIIGGAYFLGKISNQQSTPAPTPVPTSQQNSGSVQKDEQTGDKIYTNNVWHYSIRFPQGWTVNDRGSVFIGLPGEAVFTYPGEEYGSPFNEGIAIFASNEKVGLRLSYKGNFTQALAEPVSSGDNMSSFKIANTKIDGQDAVQFVQRSLPGIGTEIFYAVVTWVAYKDINYYFEFNGREDFIKQKLSLYNQILSTFKFTQ